MIDIMLDHDGDIRVSLNGDIALTRSIRQAINTRLRWIHNEWRLGPELGFRWFDEVYVKNPNVGKIRQMIRKEILDVEGVTSASVDTVRFDAAKRSATFVYTCRVGEETFKEEVTLYG